MDKTDERAQETGEKKKDSLWKWRNQLSFFSSSCPTKKCLTNQRWSVYLYRSTEWETIKKKDASVESKNKKRKGHGSKSFFNQIDVAIYSSFGSVDLTRVSFDCSFMFPYLVLLSWLLLLCVLQASLILSAAQRQQKRGIYIEVDGR